MKAERTLTAERAGQRLLVVWGFCLAVLLAGTVALGGDPPVPPNDECVDAIPFDTGTCEVSGAVCHENVDCPVATCSSDGTDCTAGAELCTNHDLCESKACVDGPTPGEACLDDADCGGGTCEGSCGLSGGVCSGPPGEEPQCAGQDTCEPEKCVLRVVGTTSGAVSTGEWFGFGAPTEQVAVPGVWLSFTATGTYQTLNGCHPLVNYHWNASAFCGGCARPRFAFPSLVVHQGATGLPDCDPVLADWEFTACGQEGVEYLIYVYGDRNPCERSCLLSDRGCADDADCQANSCVGPACATGESCVADEDCPANACNGSTCLTGESCVVDEDCPSNLCDAAFCAGGEACTVDEDCPADTCLSGRCPLTAESCLSDADCPDVSTGDFEFTLVDSGEPCSPVHAARADYVDCLVGNQVQVVDALLSDDGDDDGWADTDETVEMRLRVRNIGDEDLTGLVAEISTDDPKIASIVTSTMDIGDLAAKESVVTAATFRFVVGSVERTSVEEDFSVHFDVALRSNEWDSAYRAQKVVLDLDLDAAGGVGPTSYHEGFESGDLGTFEPMDLDLFRDTPEGADGFRCQYNDWGGLATCAMAGTAENAEAFHWRVEGPEAPDGGRSFEGAFALRQGDWTDDGQATTPIGVLEAVRSGEPLNIGWGRVCAEHRTVACAEDEDCPVGEACVGVDPELSFKHQVSFFASRKWCEICDDAVGGGCTGAGSRAPCETKADCPLGEVCRENVPNQLVSGSAPDRGIVQVQRAAADGSPIGYWTTLQPHVYAYDSRPTSGLDPCSFDPIDDGNTEDDYYSESPSQPAGTHDPTRFGPSSTCAPQYSFSYQGYTELAFDASHTGRIRDGDGLEGATGVGTWVEPKIDLRRYRGQRIRLRFLNSALSIGPGSTTWGAASFWGGWIDGWWIDDVRVHDLLESPAILMVDDKTCRPGHDTDGDGVVDCRDCAPRDGASWSPPQEARQLRLSHEGGAGGMTTLDWQPVTDPGGSQREYFALVRGPGLCEESSQGETTDALDTHAPASGELLQFLVRARNACGLGSLGRDTAGNPRSGCP